MNRPEAPCQFCCGRHIGCHSACEPYKKYQKAQKEYREFITQQKIAENRLGELEVNRFKK